jgi:hypothetical protein
MNPLTNKANGNKFEAVPVPNEKIEKPFQKPNRVGQQPLPTPDNK